MMNCSWFCEVSVSSCVDTHSTWVVVSVFCSSFSVGICLVEVAGVSSIWIRGFTVIDRMIFFTILRFLAKENFKLLQRYFSCDDISFLLGLEVHSYINSEFVCVLLLEIQVVEDVDWVRFGFCILCWRAFWLGHVGNKTHVENCQHTQGQLALMCSFS